ncbi:MAG: adenylate kinase [Hyperthermus sp.]|nr:MAG: adenylate kinase [Hyperthermus sp.]
MPPRNPFITLIVTGVPGVGKTTVLAKVSEMLSSAGREYMVVNFGDYMLKEAMRNGWVSHRDEMRHLPLRRQLELQEMAARSIREDAEKTLRGKAPLLVDTHAIIKTPTGYWPGLPENVVRELRPDSIVLVEADPEAIYARQVRDSATRRRSDIGGVEGIRSLMEVARQAALSSATLVAASVFIVVNEEGRPEEAAKRIVDLIDMLG